MVAPVFLFFSFAFAVSILDSLRFRLGSLVPLLLLLLLLILFFP